MRLRVPGWCRSAQLTVNGEAIDLSAIVDRGYADIRRRWTAADNVVLTLAMPAERIYAHPDVRVDQGRVALKRGPILYCLEAADNAAPVQRLALPRRATIETRFEPDLLGGCTTLSGAGATIEPAGDELYGMAPHGAAPATFKAVPYHLWDHRAPGEMAVWLPEA